jgi:hypothetical protein
MPIECGTLDGVVSWGVIEHDEVGPGAALGEFFRVLRPGGWLFVTVPFDTPAQRAASRTEFGEPTPHATFFQYFFTEKELADAVAATGFRVDEVTPSSHHYALAMPRTYARLTRTHPVVQAVTTRTLNVLTTMRRDTFNMILAVAQKPNA